MRYLKLLYLLLVISMVSCSTDQEADLSSSIIDERQEEAGIKPQD